MEIERIFNENGIDITQEQCERLETFGALLLEYNEMFNLTAITDPREIVVKHFLDSVSGARFLSDRKNIVDIGSGAGFPSVPLSIFLPNARFTMIDSVNKKVKFLEVVIERLGLNAEAKHTRVEDEGRGAGREGSDACIARAVSALPTLAEYALPLLKIGGLFLAYKGDRGREENAEAQRAIATLGGKTTFIEEFELDGNKRTLIGVQKIKSTPDKYPRTMNKPRINPLV